MRRRPPPQQEWYRRRSRDACFVCELVAGNPEYAHHVVYEDDAAIAFLNAFPTLHGYTLVCPRKHREHVTGDFALDEYLQFQEVLYRVAEAVRRAVPTERVYLLSLGSRDANSHVHWHVAPLPPGVPFDEQQIEALSWRRGILDATEEELAALAAAIRGELA